MKIAVTGGTGFIGSHVVDHLADAGHEVRVIDLRPPHRGDVAHCPVDIRDLDGLVDATAGVEVVFHLAAFADVNDVAGDPVGAADANILATAKVWEACRRNDVKRAVLASTVWVYGAAPDGEGSLDESSSFELDRAGHLYTASKLAAELVAQSYRELYDVDFTILRYGIPYGPRMRPALVIPKFVTMALNGDPITVHGDGSQFRNYVYVEDLARAHVLALDDRAANQVLNLEGRERVTIRHLVDAISGTLDRAVQVSYSDARAGDYEGREISAAKADALIGWRPTVGFDEGLRRYVDWHLDELVAAVPVPDVAPEPTPAPEPALGVVAATGLSWRSIVAGAIAGTAILPAIAAASRNTPGDHAVGVLTVVAAVAAVASLQRWRRPARSLSMPVGAAAAATLIWLIGQAPFSWELVPLGVLLAVVFTQLLPGQWVTRASVNAGLATAAALVIVQAAMSSWTLWAAAAAAVGGLAALAIADREPARRTRAVSWQLSAGTVLVTAILGSFVGASSASAAWFGTLVTHGPRSGNQVALTFNGRSVTETESVLQILDDNHVKATFFTSGEALRSDPTVARQLVQKGQLVGDAGFSSRSSLPLEAHPTQLSKSQQEFEAQLGVCPTFVRPPRGLHTPLTARMARTRSMTLVTWDIGRLSTHDDGARLAAEVLSAAKPGSIISLSLRDAAGANGRGAVSSALPLILQGLKDRNLQPVGLDRLLDTPGYAGRCT